MFKNKGNEAFTKNDFQAAIQFYMKAIQFDPAHEGAWNNMGLAYRSTKDFRSAIKCFEKAIAINPNNEQALANKEACEYEVNRAILGLTKKEKEKPKLDIPRHSVSNENLVQENVNGSRTTDQGRSELSETIEPNSLQSQRAGISSVERETGVSDSPTRDSDSRRSSSDEGREISANDHKDKGPQNTIKRSYNEAKDTVLREDSRSWEQDTRRMETEASYDSTHDDPAQRSAPPPPDIQRESRREEIVPRNKTARDRFIVEQRMGPLGLRPTTVIRTARENEYIDDYRKQRKGRTGFSADRRNNMYENMKDIDEEDVPAPPPDYEGPVGEATMKDLYDQRTKRGQKEKSTCPYCRNTISSENRNIRCIECGSFFCSTCERDFRGTREKGQKAVCAKCYIKEIKEKERERKESEREKNNMKKVEEQRRLREKLEEERRLRDKLEEEKRRIRDKMEEEKRNIRNEMEEEKRKIRNKLDEERRKKERLEEESRFREQLDKEREKMREKLDQAKRELEREYMLQHQLDERNRKDSWLHRGFKDTKELDERNEVIEKPKTGGQLWSSDETTIKSLHEEPAMDASTGEDESVFDVLARRFETGEITSEEYEKLIEEALEDE